jgi:hypothetical protein
MEAEYPGANQHPLFEPSWDHPLGEQTCEDCDNKRRPPSKSASQYRASDIHWTDRFRQQREEGRSHSGDAETEA